MQKLIVRNGDETGDGNVVVMDRVLLHVSESEYVRYEHVHLRRNGPG